MRSLANNPRTNASTTRTLSGQDATATSATAAASAMEVRTTFARRMVAAGDRPTSRRMSSPPVLCERDAEGDLLLRPRPRQFGVGSPAVG